MSIRLHRPTFCRITGLLLVLAAATTVTHAQAPPRSEPDLSWPNAESRANSDPWIAQNHDRISRMRPKLLVLNFVDGLLEPAARVRVDRLIAALRESSRHHGDRNPNAPAFLEYEVARIVDLTDGVVGARQLANGSQYPRIPGWNGGDFGNFRYGELFTADFAGRYGFADPDRPGRFLDLEALVDRGVVHEVWLLCVHDRQGGPYESTEVKQVYDGAFHKVPGRSVQAGNGGSPDQPFIGRSLRILFLNVERGPGCAMESLGHSMEGMSRSRAVPYFSRYFDEYAGLDLGRRYGLPLDSLYGREPGTEVDYPTPSSLSYTWRGRRRTLEGYVPAGGNVHFMPSGRRDYDLDNPATVLSTIENFHLRNGPDGQDRAEPWTVAKFARYRRLADDCMGPWAVYWRQNMPGLGNHAVDDDGLPMKNWWPFLFY